MSEWSSEKSPWRTPAEERYQRDPVFSALVKVLLSHIEAGNYTPTELREACHLAACMYEWTHVRPMLMDPTKPFIWNLKGK